MLYHFKKWYICLVAEKNYRFYLKLLPIYLKCFFRNVVGKPSIVIHAWVNTNDGDFLQNNWGDDLNKYFYEAATGRKVFFIPGKLTDYTKLALPKHYICIGSVLSFYNITNAIVCGGGYY